MRSFRFLHAADIHLDSPLVGLARQEGGAADRIRGATRLAFDDLISWAIDEKVDFIIIAGDLYDGDWRDFQTGLFFTRQMGRLAKAKIPAFLLYGNHDAESQITRRLSLPDSVSVFPSKKPHTFEIEELSVALHGQSFAQRDVTENLVPAYSAPVSGMFNIGVLHTAIGGMGEHANYAPCTLDELVAKGYDYWALGHVHNAAILHQTPHIVFPGNLQGRHIRETGPKGASLVTVVDGEVSDCDSVPFDVVRWERLQISVNECTRISEVYDRMQRVIEEAQLSIESDRLLACRLELVGRTPLHNLLLVSSEQLHAEAQAAAFALGDELAWVEKVVVSTEPETDAAQRGKQQDALGELRKMLAGAHQQAELVALLQDGLGEMTRKLPADVRSNLEDPILRAAVDGDYQKLLGEVSDYLGARLTAGES